MKPELLIPILAGIAVVVVIALVILHDKQRCAAIRDRASALGYRYQKKGADLFRVLKNSMPVFSQGHSRRISNLLEAEIDEGAIAIFDYRYTTGHGKHQQTHRHAACLIRSSRVSLPSMEIRPEHWGHKLANMIGFQDINFDERPDFSKMYRVKSKDEAGARTIISPLFMDFMTAIDKRPCVETIGDCFLFYRPRRTLKAEEIQALASEALEAFRALARASGGAGESSGVDFMGEAMSA